MKVLILVVMEYGLRLDKFIVNHLYENVLILVVMEYGLRPMKLKTFVDSLPS